MLLISSEAAISSICSSTSLSSTTESIVLIDGSLLNSYPLITDELIRTEDPCFDFTRFIALLQARLKNVNWLVVTAFFQILRNILKSLKPGNGDHECVFMDLVISSLIKMPWNLFSGVSSQTVTVQVNSGKADLLDGRNSLPGIKGILLGSVLQLLCSLVEQNDPEDEGDGPLEELAICSKFINLVPQLFSCYFSKCLGHKDKGLSRYLRYKMLVSIASTVFSLCL